MLRVAASSLAAVLCLALASPHARAQEVPEQGFYIGFAVGGNIVLSEWDLAAQNSGWRLADHNSGAVVGLRLGGHLTWWLGLEGGISVLPYEDPQADTSIALSYTGDVLFHVIRGRWVPFVDVGFGGYHNLGGPFGDDIDYHVHWGVGMRGMLTDRIALRIDARHALTDAIEGVASNIEITAGLDLYALARSDKDDDGIQDADDACPTEFGQASARGCPDRDGDGIKDSADRCPDAAGGEALDGCPDKDSDGVADRDDQCPDRAGLPTLKGCPDADGDGIRDQDDECPNAKGLASMKGCPDTDGDGIRDQDDACPKQAGPEKTRGCPDADGDGVKDSEDRCKDQPGPPELKGCPDRDNDGVPDIDDKCPDEAGVRSEQGCLPKKVKKFTGAIRGIYFESGSAKILPRSFRTLDKAVDVLKEYGDLRLRIEGHTDNQGGDKANMKLSKARAASVKDYMVERGIDTGRLETEGYGEERPVADNKTRRGRAKNRRIEFTIIR